MRKRRHRAEGERERTRAIGREIGEREILGQSMRERYFCE